MKSASYIKGYDGLRAVSILMVLVTHLGFTDTLDSTAYFTKRLIQLFSGNTGVNIFFTLSGFLITQILLTEKIRTGTINLKHFFIRRLLRLLPPLLLFLLTATGLMYFGYIRSSFVGVIFSMFYVYNFIPDKFYTGELGHLWSLAVEEQFYLFWPFVVRFLRYRKMILMAAVILAICVVAQWLLPSASIFWNNKYHRLSDMSHVGRWFFPAVAPIMMGAVAYVLLQIPPVQNYMKNSGYLLLWTFVLFCSPLIMPDIALGYAKYFQSMAIVLLLVWLKGNQVSPFTALLEFVPLSYLGRISYGVYIYHGLFLRTGPGGTLGVQQFPYNLVLTLLIAVLSYELFEKRVLKLKERFR
jgi:peptidoglycan/LPS O-acetylase OafA/YrhL